MVYTELSRSGFRVLLWVPTVICILAVVARVAIRVKRRIFGVDDGLMIVALAFLIISSSLVQHNDELPDDGSSAYLYNPDNWGAAVQYITIIEHYELTQISCMFFGKASVGFQLLRLLGYASKWRRWFVIVAIYGLAVVFFVSIPATMSSGCEPDNPIGLLSGCIDDTTGNAEITVFYVYHASIDLAFSAVPMTFIFAMHARPGKKFCLFLLLCMGWIAGIASILRYVFQLRDIQRGIAGNHFTVLVARLNWITTQIDRTVPIFCGSLGAIAPLFRHWTVRRPWASIDIAQDEADDRAYRRQASLPGPMAQRETEYPAFGRELPPTPSPVSAGAPTVQLNYSRNEADSWRLSRVA